MQPITLDDYFAGFTHTNTHRGHADALLVRVNATLADAEQHGCTIDINPSTGTHISGQTYGGFRPQDCPQGAPRSSHKTGEGIDIYDPDGDIDEWLNDEWLTKYGLYREHPSATRGWVHFTTRPPLSGRRSFYP
jgi:hypothetical protein